MYVNTCTIRENADNRMYGNLGQLKAIKDQNPGLLLVVGGCAAQKDRDLIRDRAPGSTW
jgi:tRNA-2-methylthio-N6-dimethylallyladenosine synthase